MIKGKRGGSINPNHDSRVDFYVVAKVPLETQAASVAGISIGELRLFFEGIDPEQFCDYNESLTFPEWFVFRFMRDSTLLDTRRAVENAGGEVLSVFVNQFNLVDRIEGVEARPIGAITYMH